MAREVAWDHGVILTFLPKPIAGKGGNGMNKIPRQFLALGRKPKGEATADSDKVLPFAVDTAVRVLGSMIGIEDLIWTASLQRVEAEAKAEADEKNA